MNFSSITFLIFLLPMVLGFYYLSSNRWRNSLLFAFSVLFYSWSSAANLSLLLIAICFGWGMGLWIFKAQHGKSKLFLLSFSVSMILLVLIYYKYFGFFLSNLEALIPRQRWILPLQDAAPVIPIGISFFLFHSISYLVDIYRGDARPFKKINDMALYIAFFPMLVAGPIVRYRDIAEQINCRRHGFDRFCSGLERFIYGLAKKVLIADSVARAADHVFALSELQLSTFHSWFGLSCYTIQIYFDFSGYSDMAIGLSRMFGFEIQENFNYPYTASSIREFWRRWHLSLSAWFRDYLYIPLGGSHCSPWRNYMNLILIFGACGMWHGASWNFIVWGLFHGFFLVLERKFSRFNLGSISKLAAHVYVLIVVMVGWALFRTQSFGHFVYFADALLGYGVGTSYGNGISLYYNPSVWVPMATGVVLSWPLFSFLARDFNQRMFPITQAPAKVGLERFLSLAAIRFLRFGACIFCLLFSYSFVAGETFHPFIYFQF